MTLEKDIKELIDVVKRLESSLQKIANDNAIHFQEWRNKNLGTFSKEIHPNEVNIDIDVPIIDNNTEEEK